MTWVLGFPITFDYAVQYAKDFRLNDDNRRSGLVGRDRNVSVLSCWVKGNIRCVYGLYVDRHSKTAAIAESRLHPSFLPPLECSLKLMGLLRTDDGPWWYRYDDTRPQEGDGDIEGMDEYVTGDKEGASGGSSESEVPGQEFFAQGQGDVSGDGPRGGDMSEMDSGRSDVTIGAQPALCTRMENHRV